MDIMARPKADIFSTFVFNNIMALSFNYCPPFFFVPHPPKCDKSFIVSDMKVQAISPNFP